MNFRSKPTTAFQRCVLVLTVAVGCIFLSREARGEPVDVSGLSKDEQALLQEYKVNYPRLKHTYDNLKMEVVWRGEEPRYVTPDNPSGKAAVRYVYRTNGDKLYRMDMTVLDWTTEEPQRGTVVEVVRPEGRLTARADSPDQEPVLSDWNTDFQKGFWEFTSRHAFPRSPYSRDLSPMEWYIIRRPSTAKTISTYRIEEVSSSLDGTERLVTIRSRAVAKHGGREWKGRYVFLRDRAWALKEYACENIDLATPQNTERRYARYAYEGDYDGVALLKRLELWTELCGGRRKLDSLIRYKMDVADVVSGGSVHEQEASCVQPGV